MSGLQMSDRKRKQQQVHYWEDENTPRKKVLTEPPEKSKLIKALKEYTVVPGTRTQERMNYFFGPYNGYYNLSKCMKFDET